jgi:hypothetical protein
MGDELFVMLDTTLSSFCWQRRGLQFEERLTLGQPAVVKLRTRVLQLDLLEACKKCCNTAGYIRDISFVTLRAD